MDAREGGSHGKVQGCKAGGRRGMRSRLGCRTDAFGAARAKVHGAIAGGRGSRAGYDRVRHLGRSARGDRHIGDYGFPPPPAGALECHCRRHKRFVARRYAHRLRRLAVSDAGQSTVEFAIVTFGFLAVAAALALLWHALSGNMVAEHAAAVASHHIQAVALGTLPDIFLF